MGTGQEWGPVPRGQGPMGRGQGTLSDGEKACLPEQERVHGPIGEEEGEGPGSSARGVGPIPSSSEGRPRERVNGNFGGPQGGSEGTVL